ncbi:uncharacterized protein LOC110249358 [Exaiptasia diaphana]|uniref:Eph LBD domain-containing protein n=1 Tax=Exaiptasia diaphana TaxID=2652724 RepID=A0A913YRF9_EXADI|nr:uncharacterized protein LOC110249358 [Exaiptasia diaphana]
MESLVALESMKEYFTYPSHNCFVIFKPKWKKDHGPKKPVFTVCDVSPSQEPNLWLRSLEIHVKNATRVDVTLKYAVSKCTMIKHCKDNLQLFVHKTSWKYGNLQNKVPEPNKNIESYQNFGTTKPRSISKDLDKPELNNETYSFFTNRSTPYYYLAIRYQGGCFRLFEVVLSYSFCSSMALSSNLVHLTETIAPANGTIQIGGSCAQNAQPLADNMTLYGNCMANGEWSSHAIGGECLCMAGFGKYLNGTSASCKSKCGKYFPY